MNRSESFHALRRANPRAKPGFPGFVAAATDGLRAWIVATVVDKPQPGRRRSVVRLATAGVALAAAAAVAAFFTVGLPGDRPGIESAAAAVRKAASVTASSARESGTAIVGVTHNGKLWARTTVRWHGDDLTVASDVPRRVGRPGSELRLVDGLMYGVEPDEGGWVMLGSPDSIDPGSGTTPTDYLSAVREDVGGVTLRRIGDGMTAGTRRTLDDGSTVYSGTVRAGLIATESGFKEGQSIRVFPFGYVAHDEASDPAAPLDAAVTVGADGIVRELAVTWGSAGSAWTYTVTYSRLGATPAPIAPADARPLRVRG